jgi:TATA-box binding protein (TBP) (component of TFIID and TFIIIB)
VFNHPFSRAVSGRTRVSASSEDRYQPPTFGAALNLPIITITLGLVRPEYEPEQHPALSYRPDEPAGVLLIVSSGKLVITGTTDPTPAATALTNLADTLTDLGLREA